MMELKQLFEGYKPYTMSDVDEEYEFMMECG